jgi:hypothetical protein
MEEYKVVVFVIVWFILSALVANLGKNKQIGFNNTFLASLLLSPVIGYIFVLLSPPEPIEELTQSTITERFKYSLDSANRAAFMGQTDKAVNLFKDTLNYLENDYDKFIIEAEQNRHAQIVQISGWIKILEQKRG